MRAIFIDSKNKTVSEIQIKDWKEIAPKLGCDLFTCVNLPEDGETLYIDDEGLLTINEESTFLLINGYPEPLAGNGIILGTKGNGDSKNSSLTLEEVRENVRFLSLREVQILLSAN
jgi:hypothetical protein